MTTKNQIQLLKDPETEPTNDVLENALGMDVFTVYEELINGIMPRFGLDTQWRFYNDGKAWLCKVVYKKKTVFWLSVWERFLKTSFFYTEKTRYGVSELRINQEIKDNFLNANPVGKLIPLILDIDRKEQLEDLQEIISYKISLK